MMSYQGNSKLSVLAVFHIAMLLFVLPLAFGADSPKKLDGKQVFEQKCLKCHKIEKFNTQRYDRKGWDLVLSRMELNTCNLTDEEARAVGVYLSKTYGE